MFQKAKQALMKKVMKSQLGSLPADQRELLENLIDNHPDLLMLIAQDLQAEMKTGKDQMAAMQAVALKHQDALKKVVGNGKLA